MAEMNEILGNLTEALDRLGAARVPPPMQYNGTSNVTNFFETFENYCRSIYGNQQGSWLQILPTFMEGEPRNIVNAFGAGGQVTYAAVKERVVLEMQRGSLGRNSLTDVLTCKRRVNETLLCYSIRLQQLAKNVTDLPEAQRDMIVKTKFVSILQPSTVTQISIRYGGEANTTIDQMVRLAELLENGEPTLGSLAANQTSVVPQFLAPTAPHVQNTTPPSQILRDSNVGVVTGANNTPVGGSTNNTNIRCFKCGNSGHVSSQCSHDAPLCYECHQPGHIRRDCLVRRNREQQNGGQRQGGRGANFDRRPNNRASRGRPSRIADPGRNYVDNGRAPVEITCGFCGGDHLIKDCAAFNEKVAQRCVWCGERNHASYECAHKPSGN